MRYHFVINGYSNECLKQMQEQKGVMEAYLADMEAGETFVYCRDRASVEQLGGHHTEETVLLTAQEYVPERVLEALAAGMNPEELYIFGSDFAGTELAVRAAARLGGTSATAVQAMSVNDGVFVRKMVYSNHMEGTFRLEKGPYCIALAKGLEKKALSEGAFVVSEEVSCETGAEHIVSAEFYPEEAKSGLEDAKVVLVAGRGIKKKENVDILERVAESLGGEVGVSRPAAMNAWRPMNRLVGVSGAMIGPELCITAGVSGAAAFYSGIEKSRYIVAINTDEKAPIMKMADVAVADDFLPVLEALEILINENK